MNTTGTAYVGDIIGVVLTAPHMNTVLVNLSDREMVFGIDPELEEQVTIPKHGMLLIRAGTSEVFGMAPRARPSEQARLFYYTANEEVFSGAGSIYSRKSGGWVQAIPGKE